MRYTHSSFYCIFNFDIVHNFNDFVQLDQLCVLSEYLTSHEYTQTNDLDNISLIVRIANYAVYTFSNLFFND